MGMMEKMDDLTSTGAREYLTFRLDQESAVTSRRHGWPMRPISSRAW